MAGPSNNSKNNKIVLSPFTFMVDPIINLIKRPYMNVREMSIIIHALRVPTNYSRKNYIFKLYECKKLRLNLAPTQCHFYLFKWVDV